MAKAWDWIKKHGAMVIAIGAGLVVAFYLFFRPSGGTPVASTVSFPASGGGGGGSTGGSAPPPAPSTPTLPYSPDFSVLQAITDAALRALYEKEYNLETQINQATLQGNTALINALTSALGNVQDQIKNYQPPAPTPTPTPTPTPGNATAPTLDPNFEQNLVSQYFAAVKKLGKAFDLQAFWRQELGAYNIPNAVADYVMNRAQAWNAATGSAPVTTAQVQAWLNQAYAQGLGNPTGSTPSSANRVGA